MATISYSRRPLVLLRASESNPEEVLEFLNRYSSPIYELAKPLEDSSTTIYVTTANDRSTTRGIIPSTVLLHDPERGGVKFLHGSEELHRFGVDPLRLEALEAESSREENLDQIFR